MSDCCCGTQLDRRSSMPSLRHTIEVRSHQGNDWNISVFDHWSPIKKVLVSTSLWTKLNSCFFFFLSKWVKATLLCSSTWRSQRIDITSWVCFMPLRCPSMCAGLFNNWQGIVSVHPDLEGESGSRGRRCSHSSGPKQNRPPGRDCDKKVKPFIMNESKTSDSFLTWQLIVVVLFCFLLLARKQRLWLKDLSWGFTVLQWKRT